MSDITNNQKNYDKTVYILDSYGLIFRCYFAFISRPLTNSKGENISALFGFFRNLHYIIQHYKPNYIIAAMDSKTKTFRHEMYPAYKATRNKTPEDLHAQIPWIVEILEALGVPVLQCDGYEADDIIATVARKCEEQGRECRILSGDKDLMQLVTKSTQILKPENGGGWKITGEEGVFAEWGVKPVQLLDLLSLYGDTADNIPGVQGIGVKTADKLLTDYTDLDGIYAHIDDIKGAVQKKLIEGKENAYFSQKLVRLNNEVPCSNIDDVINSDNLDFEFGKAADLLKNYGAYAVAKSYAELSVGSGNSAAYDTAAKTSKTAVVSEDTPAYSASSSSDSSASPKPAFDSADEQILEIHQNTGDYKALTTKQQLHDYISDFLEHSETKQIAYDSETTGLDAITDSILGFSLSWKAGTGVYIPLQQKSDDLFNQTDYIEKKDAFEELIRIFCEPSITVIMHNAKFDIKMLATNGFPQKFTAHLVDTMIAAWLLSPDRTGKNAYGLEYLGETKLGLRGIEFDDIVEKGQTFADVTLEKATPYAAEDADFTYQLWQKLGPQIEERKLNDLYENTEMKLVPILAKMELTGIHLDRQILNTYNEELTLGIAAAEKSIYETVGHEFNIASPKQLQTVLFEERHLKPGKKTKTGYSTDTSVLEELALFDPVPRMILEYREMAKLQSTYVETLPKMTDSNERIHTDFVQTGTATGRLSCREPNLQNIPVKTDAGRKIRSAFTAPEGKVLISADYSQIELVVLSHLSGDENMCNAFINGIDVHKATASLIFGVPAETVTPEMRRTAKTINFGVIYGMSAFRLANDLGISRTQAAQFIESYFRTYSSINNFINQTIHDAEANGYVETIFGRRRPIININSVNKIEKAAAERMAVNTPVQGSAADIVKTAMLKVNQALIDSNSQARLLLQVHDELILECPDDQKTIDETIALIRNCMESAVHLKVPLRVSIEYGKNWGEFH